MECKLSGKIFYKAIQMKIIDKENRIMMDILKFYGAEELPVKVRLLTAAVIAETEKLFKEERNG